MSYFAKKKKSKKKAKGKRKGKAPRKGPRRKGKAKRKGTAPTSSAQQRLSDSALVKLYGAESEIGTDEHDDEHGAEIDTSKTLNSLEEIEHYLGQIDTQIDFELRKVAHPCDLREEAAAMESAEPSPIEDDSISEIKEVKSRRKLFFVPIESIDTGCCSFILEMLAGTRRTIGFLVCDRGVQRFAPFKWTRAALRKFLCEDESECVVCCEDLYDARVDRVVDRESMLCRQCSVRICVVCVLAIAFDNPELIHKHSYGSRTARFQCPACRFDWNTTDITQVGASIVQNALLDEVTDVKLRHRVLQNARKSERFKKRKCECCCAFAECRRRGILKSMKRKDKFQCADCKSVYYCSAQCRDKARTEHQGDCRLWSLS